MSNISCALGNQTSASSGVNIIAEVNQPPLKRKRNLPGNPDPDAEVIALSPTTLMARNRFVCEICNKGFQRDQNLQLHRRGYNLPWKLKQRNSKEVIRKKVYLCPERSCVHHEASRALGDLTGIKKHFSRKHGEKTWKCERYNAPFFHHQASDMNTLVPPSFGQQQNENSYGQLHTNINLGYQMDQGLGVPVMTAINPAGSQMHQDQGYPIPQNYNEPFYNQEFMTQQVKNNPVIQQDAQGPSQQIHVERDGGDGHLIIELEWNVTTNRSRLRWTPELQRRFNRAVRELGGNYKYININ